MYEFSLSRMLAVAERDLRRFRRNRAFMVPMVLMPIVYLVILGQAMSTFWLNVVPRLASRSLMAASRALAAA